MPQSLKQIFAELEDQRKIRLGIETPAENLPKIAPVRALSSLDLKIKGKAAYRKNKRKEKKMLAKLNDKNIANQIGQLFYIRTTTRICPFNTKGGTDYLIPSGSEFLAEKTLSGYKIYIKWWLWNNIKQIRENCKTYIVKKREIQVIRVANEY